MTFISYAQNFEDVMLWRALKDVEQGFYVDIGANDPVIDSVTKAFYDRGWRGINIEPLSRCWKSLAVARPEDVNLLCAVGESGGELEIWDADVRGWASASSEVISRHQNSGHTGVMRTVPVTTLKDVCSEYVSTDIHFLKIDVEGMEKSVIAGMDFKRYRPWVLVIEANAPNSTTEVYEEWEPILFYHNYLYAYGDGLNRFYVSQEHGELLQSLRYPPNVFDDFVRSEQIALAEKAKDAEEQMRHLDNRRRRAETKAEKKVHDMKELTKRRAEEVRRFQQEANQNQETILELEGRISQADERAVAYRREVTEFRNRLRILEGDAKHLRDEAERYHNESTAAKAREKELREELKQTIGDSDHLRMELTAAYANAKRLEENIEKTEAAFHQSQSTLEAVFESKSWRITAPLRWGGSIVQRVGFDGLTNKLQQFLRHTAVYLSHRLWLRNLVMNVLDRAPPLKSWLVAFTFDQHPSRDTCHVVSSHTDSLSPYARRVLSELKSAIARHKGESA